MSKQVLKKLTAAALAVSLVTGMGISHMTGRAVSLKLNRKNIIIKAGRTYKLKVVGKYKGKVKWTTGNKKIATVSSKGVVKGIAKGITLITAKTASGKLKCRVTVKGNNKNVVPSASPSAETVLTPTASPVVVPDVVPTGRPTETPALTPTPTAAPPTEEPEPTETPRYMSEGAFVYDKLDISWIDPDKPMIAFTYDDGPVGSSDTSYGMRIQKVLNDYGFHATFNYVTHDIGSEKMDNEVLAAMEAGHEIGNHTSQWGGLGKMADGKAVADEIEKARATLSGLTGISDFTLRPPNLDVNAMVQDNCNVPLIGCSISSMDWEDDTTKEHIVTETKKAKDGDIVLLHETMEHTVEATEELVPYFAEQGYQIVSVVELFAVKDIPLYAGNYYNKAEYQEPRSRD